MLLDRRGADPGHRLGLPAGRAAPCRREPPVRRRKPSRRRPGAAALRLRRAAQRILQASTRMTGMFNGAMAAVLNRGNARRRRCVGWRSAAGAGMAALLGGCSAFDSATWRRWPTRVGTAGARLVRALRCGARRQRRPSRERDRRAGARRPNPRVQPLMPEAGDVWPAQEGPARHPEQPGRGDAQHPGLPALPDRWPPRPRVPRGDAGRPAGAAPGPRRRPAALGPPAPFADDAAALAGRPRCAAAAAPTAEGRVMTTPSGRPGDRPPAAPTGSRATPRRAAAPAP